MYIIVPEALGQRLVLRTQISEPQGLHPRPLDLALIETLLGLGSHILPQHHQTLALFGFSLYVRHRKRLLQRNLVGEQKLVEPLLRSGLPRSPGRICIAGGSCIAQITFGNRGLPVFSLKALVVETDELHCGLPDWLPIRERSCDGGLYLLDGTLVVVF